MLHLPFSPLFPHKNRFFKASPHPFSTFHSNLFRFSISSPIITISIYFIFPCIFHLSLLPFPLFLLFPLSLSYLPPSISLLFIFFSLFHLISLFSLLTSSSYLSPITIISLLLSFLHYLISFLSLYLSLYLSISLSLSFSSFILSLSSSFLSQCHNDMSIRHVYSIFPAPLLHLSLLFLQSNHVFTWIIYMNNK